MQIIKLVPGFLIAVPFVLWIWATDGDWRETLLR